MRFQVGARVQIKGLAKAAEHNGKCGNVVGHHGERYKVKLVEEEKILAVKEANLEEVVVVVDDGDEQVTDDENTAPSEEEQLEEEEELCPVCLEPLASEVVDFDNSKSIRVLCCGKKLCARCVSDGSGQWGSCPFCRQTLPKSDNEAIEATRKHAERGRPWACCQIGVRHEKGLGVPQDYKLAYEWYRKAAKMGFIKAYHAIAHLHETGRGVKQSDRLAWEWHKKAADAGFALSQYRCAKMYLSGDGRKKNVDEGLRLLNVAADQGFFEAQEELAMCFYHGIGVEPSLRTAITWGLKAAKQNDAFAQYNLAVRLCEFHGRQRLPPPAAMYLWRRAAAQGFKQCRNQVYISRRLNFLFSDRLCRAFDV